MARPGRNDEERAKSPGKRLDAADSRQYSVNCRSRRASRLGGSRDDQPCSGIAAACQRHSGLERVGANRHPRGGQPRHDGRTAFVGPTPRLHQRTARSERTDRDDGGGRRAEVRSVPFDEVGYGNVEAFVLRTGPRLSFDADRNGLKGCPSIEFDHVRQGGVATRPVSNRVSQRWPRRSILFARSISALSIRTASR